MYRVVNSHVLATHSIGLDSLNLIDNRGVAILGVRYVRSTVSVICYCLWNALCSRKACSLECFDPISLECFDLFTHRTRSFSNSETKFSLDFKFTPLPQISLSIPTEISPRNATGNISNNV